MEHRFRTEEISEQLFDSLCRERPVPFTQTSLYAHWKEKSSTVRRFVLFDDGKPVLFFQIFTLLLPLGQRILYCPYGPFLVDELTKERARALTVLLDDITKKERAVFTRLQFSSSAGMLSGEEQSIAHYYFASPWKISSHAGYFQPQQLWVVDLTSSEEELFMAMHQKTRYNIRKAERTGVDVECTYEVVRHFPQFYALLKETAQRSHFSLHSEKYYRRVFEHAEENNAAMLSIGRRNGEMVAANFVVLSGATASFLFTGSSEEGRSSRALYLTRWKAMQESKRKGVVQADFGAVSQDNKGEWSGFSKFKQGFGGEVVFCPFFDHIRLEFLYNLYLLQRTVKNNIVR